MKNQSFRPVLALCLLALAAGTGFGQYVEDSVLLPVHPEILKLTYNPDADVMYGTCTDSFIFVLDCATKQIVAIDTIRFPFVFLYDSLAHKAYCPFFSSLYPDSILVLDGITHARIRTLYAGDIFGMVWASDNDRLYMSLIEQNAIQVLDCQNDSVLCRIQVGMEPGRLWVNLRHKKLYVADDYDSTITVIDRQTNRVIRRIPSGANDEWIEFGTFSETQDRLLYGPGAEDLVALAGDADTVVWTKNLPGIGYAIVEIPELGRVMVACNVSNTRVDSVFTVDIATGAIVNRIGVGDMGTSPRRLRRSPVTGLVYCVCAGSGSRNVVIIVADGSRVVATLPVNGQGFAFSPVQRRVFIWARNKVYVVRDTVGVPAIEEIKDWYHASRLRATPNPFRRKVIFQLAGMSADGARLEIFSQNGRRVLTRSVKSGGGACAVTWNGKDEQGKAVAPGIYTVLITFGVRDRIRTQVVRLR